MMESSDRVWETMKTIFDACQPLPVKERLDALSLVWLVVAKEVRDTALAFPGGYPTERSRQLKELERLADLVRDDEPDIELERFMQEGDFDSAIEYLRRLWDNASEREKGGT
jgi:hypothetical protein